MEKYEKYNPDEETIEAWLKGFEIRLLCNNITAADRKRNWCRALVGEAGNSIIEKLSQAATWAEVKAELCSVLGDGEPKKRAFEILSRYKPKSKGLGEMASDIMAKAAIATNDADLQTQLGLKAFLKAVPRNIGRELRRRHFDSVREALAEARFLQFMEEDEDRDNGKVFPVKEKVKPVEEPKVDLNQVVEACMKQLQALQAHKKQSERPRSAQKRLRCWCCKAMGHLMRACPVVQQNKLLTASRRLTSRECQIVPDGSRGCQRVPEGARWYQRVPDGVRGCQMVPDGTRECQRVPDGARGCQMVSEGARGCQMVPESARGCQRVPDGAGGCQRVPDGARGCQMVSEGARGYQMVPESARGCQRVPDGASGCQMVPEGARGCQRGQIGTVVARGLGKASALIFVKVSIAGVEVDALVDTGATMSCCRWDWYQGWKDHLGALIKSKVRSIGVGHDPIKIKGLTKTLTLQWDGVGGQFQLMVLTALTDVDVVLGMDVLQQLDVKINFKNQVASPAREPCTPLEQAKTIGLLLNNPGFTFKGKIPVKEEGVEEVAKGVLRQAYREVHRVWMASERKMKTQDKRKDRKIVRESSMPWSQADYKTQLQKDLKDIRQKLSRVLGKDLAKSDKSFVEATSPVNCIEGGVLVDSACRGLVRGGVVVTPQMRLIDFLDQLMGLLKRPRGFPPL